MPESLLKRIQRVLSARAEDTASALECADGRRVMREAIREVDWVIDDVRAEQDAAITVRLQAMRRQRLFRGQIAALDGKARFAIESHREDLAEVAISQRLELEAQADHLETVIGLSASEADRLTAGVAALKIRKKEMDAAFAAFESGWRDSGSGNATPAGLNPLDFDANSKEKTAEIDVLRKQAAIADRMAILRAATPKETAAAE